MIQILYAQIPDEAKARIAFGNLARLVGVPAEANHSRSLADFRGRRGDAVEQRWEVLLVAKDRRERENGLHVSA
ncbi:MAG: hypothetical protein HY343_04430 [Lentisphaerae bacterium]|nr:hypothetical protein [Lentisphaerota bacterium]